MNEISHQHARRLVRQGLDARPDDGRRLPEEQWANLQAHLENCADCRAYQTRLEGAEKRLRRSLVALWGASPGPSPDQTAAAVRETRRQRAAARRKMVFGGAAALVLMLVGLAIQRWVAGPGVPQTGGFIEVTPTQLPTPIPTPGAGDFRGVVAFDSTRSGNAEIYLLNPGGSNAEQSSLVNLTNNPGSDTDPAWSPDGEWIAFLSDRTGKREVFVTNVVGSRVVQLTDEPDEDWQGPLSWSADGSMIALTNIRQAQGGQTWITIVPLDGSGPRSLANTRGGSEPEFSPYGDRILYRFTNGERSGVAIYHVEDGQRVEANWIDNPDAPPAAPGSAFDWSSDGGGVVYLAANPALSATQDPTGNAPGREARSGHLELEGQPAASPGHSTGSQVVAVRDLNYSMSMFNDFTHNYTVAQSTWPGAFRGVSWMVPGAVLYLEDQDDARAHDQPGTSTGGCWRIQIQPLRYGSGLRGPFGFSNLCVDGGLDRSSLTPDNHWLVVTAHPAGEDASTARSLYALRMPTRPNYSAGEAATPDPDLTVGTVLRLTDETVATALPRVRPGGRSTPTNIDPQPAPTARGSLDASDLTRAPGQVLFARPQGVGSVIVVTDPDGRGSKLLAASDGLNACPRWSPDRKKIAFISNRSDRTEDELFVMNAQGDGLVQLTQPGWADLARSGAGANGSQDDVPLPVLYSCPSWSPDGQSLAVFVHTDGRGYLAVLLASGSDAGAQARLLDIGQPLDLSSPLWGASPDPGTNRIYLAHLPDGETKPQLMVVKVGAAGTPLESIPMHEDGGPAAYAGLTLSPEGRELAMLALVQQRDNEALASLETIDPEGAGHHLAVLVGEDNGYAPAVNGALAWLPADRLGLLLRGAPNDRYKAYFQRFDLNERSLETVAASEDVVYSAAWSPDGNWLLYSTESGLWGVDVQAALDRRAQPTWLSPEPVYDLDWK